MVKHRFCFFNLKEVSSNTGSSPAAVAGAGSDRLYNLGCLIALLGYFRRGVQRQSRSALGQHVILSMPLSLTSHGADTFCLPLSFVSIGRSSAYCRHKLLLYLRSVWGEALSVSSAGGLCRHRDEEDPSRGRLCCQSCPLGLDVRRGWGAPAFRAPTLFMGPGEQSSRQVFSFFHHDRHSLAMLQCWWYLCWCWWACWIPFVPGPAADRARLATPGSGGTPGAAEECMSTSEARRGAGNFTAPPNIIYRSTLMGK